MWGICFDISVLGGTLCQNVVEYETINDGDTALIMAEKRKHDIMLMI